MGAALAYTYMYLASRITVCKSGSRVSSGCGTGGGILSRPQSQQRLSSKPMEVYRGQPLLLPHLRVGGGMNVFKESD